MDNIFKSVIENIKGFFDFTVFFVILAVGVYTLLVDYSYLRFMKYNKDARVCKVIGISFLILPFVLLMISIL